MKFLGVQWCEACQNIPSKVNLAPPTTKNETQHLEDLSWYWRQHISPLGLSLYSIHWVIQKVASFEWGPEQDKAPQETQAAVETALLLGSYDPADPVVLEVAVADRDAVWRLLQAPIGGSQVLRILEQSPAILCKLLSFRKTALGLLLGNSRDWTVNHGLPSCHYSCLSWTGCNLTPQAIKHEYQHLIFEWK